MRRNSTEDPGDRRDGGAAPGPPSEATVTVMGGTGNVGSELVQLLTGSGHRVRVASSAAPSGLPDGASGYAVDLNDGRTLREALAGADAAFMMSGYDDSGLVEELERAAVKRVALLSSGAVPTASRENAVAAYHRASEAALEASGLEWTFLRPNSFMSNSFRWADAVRAGEPVSLPFADVAVATNDPRDIAAVAATALLTGGYAGAALRLTGPEALLPAQQVAILADVLGRELTFLPEPNEVARSRMEAQMPKPYVDAFFELFVAGGTDETTVRSTVEDVLGRPPRGFREWCEEHAAAFR